MSVDHRQHPEKYKSIFTPDPRTVPPSATQLTCAVEAAPHANTEPGTGAVTLNKPPEMAVTGVLAVTVESASDVSVT